MFSNDIRRAPIRDIQPQRPQPAGPNPRPQPDIQKPASAVMQSFGSPNTHQQAPPRSQQHMQKPVHEQHHEPQHFQPQQNNAAPQKKRKPRKFLKVLFYLFVLALIGGAGYGGYYYAKNIEGKNKSPLSALTGENDNASSEPASSSGVALGSNGGVHYIADAGYPFDLNPKKLYTINLGLPEQIQGAVVTSSENNRGLEKFYTDKLNDEIGRWDIGYPEFVPDSNSSISILAISQSWLGATQSGNSAFDDAAQVLNTPEQKKAYIEKIKSSAITCVSDKAKGFSTKDGIFRICYSVIPGGETFTPILVLRGYGEVEKQPLLFVGNIRVFDGNEISGDLSKRLLEEAKNGKLPQSVVAEIGKITEALAQTTLRVK